MTAKTDVESTVNVGSGKSELDLLKERADLMGISYSKNIGVDTLRQRIEQVQNGETVEEPATKSGTDVKTKSAIRNELIKENMKLIRVRIVQMNPAKANLPGEIFTVANQYIGTVRKFIPYDEKGESYHIPYALYKNLRDRTFVRTTTVRDRTTGRNVIRHQTVREFSIEVLPQLTKEELAKLATEQKAAGSIG